MSYSNKTAATWQEKYGHLGEWLVVKNWYKYQMVEHKFEFKMSAIFTAKDCTADPEFAELTMFQRG